jgi:hypothetical protein
MSAIGMVESGGGSVRGRGIGRLELLLPDGRWLRIGNVSCAKPE